MISASRRVYGRTRRWEEMMIFGYQTRPKWDHSPFRRSLNGHGVGQNPLAWGVCERGASKP